MGFCLLQRFGFQLAVMVSLNFSWAEMHFSLLPSF
jgi:hypothetical protein